MYGSERNRRLQSAVRGKPPQSFQEAVLDDIARSLHDIADHLDRAEQRLLDERLRAQSQEYRPTFLERLKTWWASRRAD